MNNLVQNGSFEKGLHGWNIDGNPLQIQLKDTSNGRCVQIPFKNSISQKINVKEKTSYVFQCKIENVHTGALKVVIKEWILENNGLIKIGHVYHLDQHSMEYQKITTNPNVSLLEVIIENNDYSPAMIRFINLMAIPNNSCDCYPTDTSSNFIQEIDLEICPHDSYWIAIGNINCPTHVEHMYTLSVEVRANSSLLQPVQIAMGIFHTTNPQTIVARSIDYTISDETPITLNLSYKPKDVSSLFNRVMIQSPIPILASKVILSSPETNYPTGTTESPYYPSSPETNYPTGTTESPYYPSSSETNYPTGTTESPYYPSSPETNYPTGTTESPYYPSSSETNYPTGTTESPYYPSSPE
uniref:hypothetical protein n=3 Tax=Bacillus TaxID=1386 RepID=UPI0018CF9826